MTGGGFVPEPGMEREDPCLPAPQQQGVHNPWYVAVDLWMKYDEMKSIVDVTFLNRIE